MMRRLAGGLLNRGYKRALFVVVAGAVGTGLGLLAVELNSRRPSGSWQKQPQPPVRLTQFAGDAPMSYVHGAYAASADGTLYALSCRGPECTWSRQDALPQPPLEPWEGRCHEGVDRPDESVAKPGAPGRAVDSYAVRFCGPDGYTDYFYVLLEDGSVWLWTRAMRPAGEGLNRLLAAVCPAFCGVGGLILGLMVVVVARRSRSAP